MFKPGLLKHKMVLPFMSSVCIWILSISCAFGQHADGAFTRMVTESANAKPTVSKSIAPVGAASHKPNVRIEKRNGLTYVIGSVVINAPREKIWDTLVDYDKSPEIFTNLSLCKVISTEGDVKLVRQLVKPGGPIKFDYVVDLTETKPSLIKWKRRSGSFREVMGTWELEPVANTSSTAVVYSIHLDGGVVLPPWLLASQVKGYLPTVLNALKTRVESTKREIKS